MKTEKPFWNPYLAGFALGLVLLGSFVLTGRGLGSSGASKHVAAVALHAISPTWTEESRNLGPFFADPSRSSLDTWIVWLAVGTALGGAVGAVTGRRFRLETLKGPRADRATRWVLAGLGGAIAGIGAQLARGCSSGQALTGGAQLALGSWVFMLAFFGGALGLAWFLRRQWL
ncbi:MAG TPA: YeeE/YedE thiosulfate transporter family protein [Anaeromyxobacteraceae bacterium]|nr:YeeE/YedE thiosulfate transporter family protein [Anaeromyxobacteraceae bacterium]